MEGHGCHLLGGEAKYALDVAGGKGERPEDVKDVMYETRVEGIDDLLGLGNGGLGVWVVDEVCELLQGELADPCCVVVGIYCI